MDNENNKPRIKLPVKEVKTADDIVDGRTNPMDDTPLFSHYLDLIDDVKTFTGQLHVTQMTSETEQKLKKRFLEIFSRSCVAKDVAYQMHISIGTVYMWRQKDPVFMEEMDRIRKTYSLALLEDKAMHIVMNSKDPKDHPLLMFMMRSYGRQFFDPAFVEVQSKKNKLRIEIQRSQKQLPNPEDGPTLEELQSILPSEDDT
jgi:hypothetical protein